MRFVVLKARVRACVNKAVAWAKRTIREALRPAPIAAGLLCDVFRSRQELLAENALLRQQLLVASRSKKRPAFRPYERGLVVFLSSIMPRWRDALLLVKPDTIIRWLRSPSDLRAPQNVHCLDLEGVRVQSHGFDGPVIELEKQRQVRVDHAPVASRAQHEGALRTDRDPNR